MSLLPVVTTRTSDPLQHQRLTYQVNADQLGLQRLYDQISTGRRVIIGSDDPAAAARAVGFQEGIAYSEQMVRNADIAGGYLRTVDTALASVDDIMIEARGVSVGAAQSILADGERQTLAQQLDHLIGRMVTIGNESFRDHALLGGALMATSPLAWEGTGIVYSGNEAVARAGVARGTAVETLPTGAEALGLAAPGVKGKELSTGMTADTRLVDARDGRGIQPGVLRLSDGAEWIDVDLRGSVTIGDIAERIAAVDFGGRQLAVDIASDALTVRYADNLFGTLAIADAPGSETARQMNLSNPLGMTAPPLVGGGLAPRTTGLTKLDDLDGGAGLDVSEGLTIRQDDQVFEVDLSAAETVDDVLAAINRSGAAVRGELDVTTGKIQLRLLKSGANYSVGENGGLAATRLGLRTATADVRLDSLDRGRGVKLNTGTNPDLTLVRPDGTVLDFDAESLATVGEMIDAINNHAGNQDADRVTAALASDGNGIVLSGPGGGGPIEVTQPGSSNLGTALGLIPPGENSQVGVLEGTSMVLRGVDYAPVETQGALDTLLRLRNAVETGDMGEIERLAQRLEVDFKRVNGTRGLIGHRSQSVDMMRIRAEDQTIEMRSRKSEEVDADYTATISEITRRQSSLEASLRLMGKTAGLTVLNFL